MQSKIVVGFMLYDRRGDELYLDYIAVCRRARRLGVATRSIAWLKEQGLVTVEEIATVQIATLTQRGLETATGMKLI